MLDAKALLALVLGAGLACAGTEEVAPDVVFLTDPSRSEPNDAWLQLGLFPNDPTDEASPYSLRIDGRLPFFSPQDQIQPPVPPGRLYGVRVDALVGTPHVFALVSPTGETVLTTEPLWLAARPDNQLVVYGDSSELHYYYFPGGSAKVAALADDEVLINVVNLDAERRAMDVYACMVLVGAIADCTEIVSGLGFGQLWQGSISVETMLGDRCSSPDKPETCYWRAYTLACLPDPSSPKLVSDPKGEFLLDNISYQHLETCRAMWD